MLFKNIIYTKKKIKMDEYLQEYILSYIPFQKCFICEKQINILDKSNYLFIIYNILYCSKKCVLW